MMAVEFVDVHVPHVRQGRRGETRRGEEVVANMAEVVEGEGARGETWRSEGWQTLFMGGRRQVRTSEGSGGAGKRRKGRSAQTRATAGFGTRRGWEAKLPRLGSDSATG